MYIQYSSPLSNFHKMYTLVFIPLSNIFFLTNNIDNVKMYLWDICSLFFCCLNTLVYNTIIYLNLCKYISILLFHYTNVKFMLNNPSHMVKFSRVYSTSVYGTLEPHITYLNRGGYKYQLLY